MKTDLSFFFLMFYIFLDVIRWHILVLIQKRLRLNVVLIFSTNSCRQLLINFFNEVWYPVGWTDINCVKNKRKNYTKKSFQNWINIAVIDIAQIFIPKNEILGIYASEQCFQKQVVEKAASHTDIYHLSSYSLLA